MPAQNLVLFYFLRAVVGSLVRHFTGDFNILKIDWDHKTALEGSLRRQLPQFMQAGGMVQKVTELARWRFSEMCAFLDLMVTRAPNDIRSRELEEQIGRRVHA